MSSPLLVLALLALPAAPQEAPSSESAAREADMFGGEPAAAASEAPAAGDAGDAAGNDEREAAMFGDASAPPAGGPPAQAPTPAAAPTSAIGNLADAITNSTDVGGNLFLRLNGNLREEQELGAMALSSPSLFDAYIDARPNERVRGFVQVRLTYDATIEPGEQNAFGQTQEPFRVLFDQGWLKFDLGRVAYVTAGRQRIRWGTGRFWNPTDFINLDIRNSVDFFDQRLGVNLVKVHFPFEELGWNLYLIGKLEGIDALGDTGVGARAEFVFGETEVALSSLVKRDAPLRMGFDVSTGLWLFDLRAEGTVQRGSDVRRFKGELDFEAGVFPDEIGAEELDDTWTTNVVVGGDIQLQYNDQDSLILGGEYFYNSAGYTSAELYPFLIVSGAFRPLYLGQHYFGAYALLAGPGAWNDTNFTLSTLGNVSDGSFLTRLDLQQVLMSWVTFNVFASVHYGRVGEFKLGLEVPPVPGVPALVNGFSLPDDLIDVGMALRMEL